MLADTVGFVFASRIALTYLFFRSNPARGAAVTAALSLALVLAVSFCVVMNPSRQQHQLRQPRPLRWLWIYLTLAACSLLWTTTQSELAAVAYWSAMAADVLAVVLLLRYRPAEEQTCHLMRGFVIGAVGVAIVAWLAPTMDDLRLGDQDFLHPNAIGYMFAIAILFAVCLTKQDGLWKWVGAALAITLLRTLSKASIVAFVAAALFYFARDSSVSRKAKNRIAFGTGLTLLCFLGILESYLDSYFQGSRAETLTGRTIIWSEALDAAMEKPWLGHGFYSFRWVMPPFGDFEAWHAHNELLQQFFAYGVVGALLVVTLYYSFYRQLRSSPNSEQKTLAGALLILALVRGVVDTDNFGLSYPLWLLAAMAIMLQSTSRRNRGELSQIKPFLH